MILNMLYPVEVGIIIIKVIFVNPTDNKNDVNFAIQYIIHLHRYVIIKLWDNFSNIDLPT